MIIGNIEAARPGNRIVNQTQLAVLAIIHSHYAFEEKRQPIVLLQTIGYPVPWQGMIDMQCRVIAVQYLLQEICGAGRANTINNHAHIYTALAGIAQRL